MVGQPRSLEPQSQSHHNTHYDERQDVGLLKPGKDDCDDHGTAKHQSKWLDQPATTSSIDRHCGQKAKCQGNRESVKD